MSVLNKKSSDLLYFYCRNIIFSKQNKSNFKAFSDQQPNIPPIYFHNTFKYPYKTVIFLFIHWTTCVKSKKAVPSYVEEITRRACFFSWLSGHDPEDLSGNLCVDAAVKVRMGTPSSYSSTTSSSSSLSSTFSAAPLPPPPASLPFPSSTHAPLSMTEELKIALGIPASIQRGGGRQHTQGHKPAFRGSSAFLDLSQLPSAFCFPGDPQQQCYFYLVLIAL